MAEPVEEDSKVH